MPVLPRTSAGQQGSSEEVPDDRAGAGGEKLVEVGRGETVCVTDCRASGSVMIFIVCYKMELTVKGK